MKERFILQFFFSRLELNGFRLHTHAHIHTFVKSVCVVATWRVWFRLVCWVDGALISVTDIRARE